jgi:hypothetical protein
MCVVGGWLAAVWRGADSVCVVEVIAVLAYNLHGNQRTHLFVCYTSQAGVKCTHTCICT